MCVFGWLKNTIISSQANGKLILTGYEKNTSVLIIRELSAGNYRNRKIESEVRTIKTSKILFRQTYFGISVTVLGEF